MESSEKGKDVFFLGQAVISIGAPTRKRRKAARNKTKGKERKGKRANERTAGNSRQRGKPEGKRQLRRETPMDVAGNSTLPRI